MAGLYTPEVSLFLDQQAKVQATQLERSKSPEEIRKKTLVQVIIMGSVCSILAYMVLK